MKRNWKGPRGIPECVELLEKETAEPLIKRTRDWEAARTKADLVFFSDSVLHGKGGMPRKQIMMGTMNTDEQLENKNGNS